MVVAALSAMNSLIKAYGSNAIDLKLILRNVAKLFEHKDKQVRKEVTALIVEICRWDSYIVESIYASLKLVQIKDLKELFSQLPKERPVPARIPKSKRSTNDEQVCNNTAEDMLNENETKKDSIDPYLTADAVGIAKDPSILSIIESLDVNDWRLRKEALSKLNGMLQVMKIEPDNFWHVVKKLVKKIADSNINVCASAIECLCSLCLGVRSGFYVYKSYVIAAAIEKLKERKKIVLDPLRELLDSLFLVSGEFGSLIEDLEEGVAHKNPQIRAEVAFWMVRSAKVYKGRLDKQVTSHLLNIALKALSDSDKIVREYAAELMACLTKLSVDPMLVESSIRRLEKQKTVRVAEYMNTVELNKPTIYESEEYLRSRGIYPVATPENQIVSGVSHEHETNKSEEPEIKNPGLPLTDKSTPGEISNDMDVDMASTENSHRSDASEVCNDSYCDARENMQLPVILDCNAESKKKRTSKPLESNKIVQCNLRVALLENAKGVLSSDVCSLISKIDHEPEAVIVEMLERILEPIGQRPESLSYSASVFDIRQEDLELRYIDGSDVLFLLSVNLLFTRIYSITMRCLLLIQTLLCLIDDKGHTLTEYEAKVLSFILLSGVNCENNDMDTMVSALFRKLARTFPASAIVGYACEVLELYPNSKKLCLEEISHLMRRSTVGCYHPEKIIPLATRILGDRDPEIRDSAGALFDVIYAKMRDSVYDYLGPPSDPTLRLVKEYLQKRKSSGIPKDLASFPLNEKCRPQSSPILSPRSPVSEVKHKEINTETRKISDCGNISRRTSAMSPLLYYQNPGSVTKENISDVSPEIQSIIARLTLRDHAHKISALKELEKIMGDEYSLIITSSCIRILTSNLLCELKYAVSYILSDENTIGRLCKHLINALAKIFCCGTVRSLDEITLKYTFVGMLDLLLELSFIDAEPCQQLSKVLNVLVIRILDNADRTQSFKVLITILREFLIPEMQLSSEFIAKHKNIAELVMKCLWKITKNMSFLIKENKVDVGQLLLNCHQFLEAVPPIEWKRRAHKTSLFQEELPLKTVKTIMKELIKSLGEDILLHTSHIPYPDQSYAVSYIKQVLKSGK